MSHGFEGKYCEKPFKDSTASDFKDNYIRNATYSDETITLSRKGRCSYFIISKSKSAYTNNTTDSPLSLLMSPSLLTVQTTTAITRKITRRKQSKPKPQCPKNPKSQKRKSGNVK
uniref:CUB domain-containing protein n=1 Tax=Strongyloides venezuelensis TaxID=75913 RepID=A0A0K0FQJ3_STRVS